MKKRSLLAGILAASLVLGSTSVFAATATTTASTVYVDGAEVAFDAFNIDGSNYFKLRDLAHVLSGTEKQFDITWDAEKNAIDMISGAEYTVAGGELEKGDGQDKEATETSAAIYINGEAVELEAFNINGLNYFKLRDVMSAFDVFVGWDEEANAITLDSTQCYEDGHTDATEEEVTEGTEETTTEGEATTEEATTEETTTEGEATTEETTTEETTTQEA